MQTAAGIRQSVVILADIHVALQYGQGTGSAQILRFVTEHTEVLFS